MLEWLCAGIVIGAGVAPFGPEIRAEPLAAVAVAAGLGLAMVDLRRVELWGLLGVLLGWIAVGAQAQGPSLSGSVSVQGVVVGAGLGRAADLECTRWAPVGGEWRPCEGRLRVRFRDFSPGPGVALVVAGQAGPVFAGGQLPGAPDPIRSAARGGVDTELRAVSVRRIGTGVERGCAVREPTGVLCAVATGVRADLDPAIVDVLRRTGTAHVLAISGFHVGVVALVAGSLLFAGIRLVAVWLPVGLSKLPVWLFGALAGLGYAWIAGAPTSAQRAAMLLLVAALARGLGGEIRPLRLLGLVAAAVVLVDPPCVGSAAFQLSFGALLGILRFGPQLQRWIPPDLPWPVDWALRGTASSIAATVGTLPASAWWFQQLAPWSPLANLVALPWCAVAVVPLSGVAAFGPEPLAGWATALGTGSVELLVWALTPLAVEPWAPAVGPIGALALLCWCAWPALPGRCLLITWMALGLHAVPMGDRVTFLDVGQGDAAWVETRGRTWLIDGGPPSDRVLHWLRRKGVRRVDVVIATHEEADHVGGLPPVLSALEIGEVWVTAEGPTSQLARGLGIPVVVRHPSLIHPARDYQAADNNDTSQVIALAGALFTGDIEREGERMTWASLDAPVPVLKVPHHGSRTSSSELLLNAVRPTVAVIGVGGRNRYGHPVPAVLERYRERGIAVYRTDRDGTVQVEVDGPDIRVRSWKAGRGWSGVARYAAPQTPVERLAALRRP